MNKHFLHRLSSLWEIAEKIHGGGGDGKAIADSIAWLLPEAQVCAVYSRPMGVLEMFAVKVGGAIVGAAGAFPEREYPEMVKKFGLVQAPCLIRPYLIKAEAVSPLITETLSRASEFQELLEAA